MPVVVEARGAGAPRAVLWRGILRPVIAVRDRWRIDDEWWRAEIVRRYFLLEVEGGHMLTVYHDVLDDCWFAQPYEIERPSRRREAGGRKATPPRRPAPPPSA